jgi:hypothetical protein
MHHGRHWAVGSCSQATPCSFLQARRYKMPMFKVLQWQYRAVEPSILRCIHVPYSPLMNAPKLKGFEQFLIHLGMKCLPSYTAEIRISHVKISLLSILRLTYSDTRPTFL